MARRRETNIALLLIVSLMAATPTCGEDQAAPGSGPCQAPAQQQSQATTPGTADTDTDLSKCGGVISPPASSGDDQIERRAPDVGRTPIIPPSKVPQQQQNDTEPN